MGGTDRVAILGDGRLGNLCAQVLARLIRPRSGYRQTLREAGHPCGTGHSTTVLSEPLDERSFDIVVDCTGSSRAADRAEARAPARDDRAETTVAGQQTLAWAPFVIDEITLVGSRCGPFDQALAALERGHVRTVAHLRPIRFVTGSPRSRARRPRAF